MFGARGAGAKGATKNTGERSMNNKYVREIKMGSSFIAVFIIIKKRCGQNTEGYDDEEHRVLSKDR